MIELLLDILRDYDQLILSGEVDGAGRYTEQTRDDLIRRLEALHAELTPIPENPREIDIDDLLESDVFSCCHPAEITDPDLSAFVEVAQAATKTVYDRLNQRTARN